MTGENAYMKAWDPKGDVDNLRGQHADSDGYFDPSASLRRRIEKMRSGDYDLPSRRERRSADCDFENYVLGSSSAKQRLLMERLKDDADKTPRAQRILPFGCL